VGARDGNVYAFTPTGAAPPSIVRKTAHPSGVPGRR
jgi:hypothetical protein